MSRCDICEMKYANCDCTDGDRLAAELEDEVEELEERLNTRTAQSSAWKALAKRERAARIEAEARARVRCHLEPDGSATFSCSGLSMTLTPDGKLRSHELNFETPTLKVHLF